MGRKAVNDDTHPAAKLDAQLATAEAPAIRMSYHIRSARSMIYSGTPALVYAYCGSAAIDAELLNDALGQFTIGEHETGDQ